MTAGTVVRTLVSKISVFVPVMTHVTATAESVEDVAWNVKDCASGVLPSDSHCADDGKKAASDEPKVGVSWMYVLVLIGRREKVTVTVAEPPM